MTYGWNRRRASEAVALAVALSLSCAASGASRPVTVRWAEPAALAGELDRYLREDQAWARQLPAALRDVSLPVSSKELEAWLRTSAAQAGAGAAASSASGGGRTAASLLRDRWLARGHLAATVAAAQADSVGPLELAVAPGPRFEHGEVVVEGADFPGRQRLLETTLPRAGAPVRPEEWDDRVELLLRGAGEAGFPFARWALKDVRVDVERGVLDITGILFTGPRAVLGAQSCDLPDGRGAAFVRRASGLVTGRPWRESEVRRARARLSERGLWARVGEPAVYALSGLDTVGVHWPITPVERPNRFAAVLGLSRARDGGGSRLSGQAELRLPNLAGTGRRLETSWFDDGRGRSRLTFGYLEPLAFGTPLDMEGTVAHEVASDLYTRISLDARARLAVVAAWGLELGLGWDRGTFPVGEWQRTVRWRARAAFLRRRADPDRSGWSAAVGFESARRQAVAAVDTLTEAATPAGGSVERQTLLDLRGEGEIYFGPTVSLAVRAAYEEVDGEGAPIPLSEQYRFGGARSVRGWREGEFRGERVAHGSVELRVGRYSQSRLYTFFDLGYFRFRVLEPTLEDTERLVSREGTVRGFGLGLETRAAGGDVLLAVGLPGVWDFERAMLHVSLLQSF